MVFQKSTLTESDTEMDERAVEAVKAAINKAKICKKPIAGYDKKKTGLCRVCKWGKKVCRIENRVAAGGHNVDSGKVIERYYKSINNIKELLDICDIMHVYDNTKSPERIIRKHKEELSIYPNEYWSEQDILRLME